MTGRSMPLAHQEVVLAQADSQGASRFDPEDRGDQSGEMEAEIPHVGLLGLAESPLRAHNQQNSLRAMEVEFHAQGPGAGHHGHDVVPRVEPGQVLQPYRVGVEQRQCRAPTLLADLLEDLLPALLARSPEIPAPDHGSLTAQGHQPRNSILGRPPHEGIAARTLRPSRRQGDFQEG
jgi:hypothetical protein